MNAHNIQLFTTTEIAGKLMEKVKFNLTDSTIIKIGKILKKQGFERIRKGNNYSYMLRFVEQSVVEKNSKTLENLEEVKNETLKVLEGSGGEGIILSVGGGVSPGMPRENIQAMLEALQEFNEKRAGAVLSGGR